MSPRPGFLTSHKAHSSADATPALNRTLDSRTLLPVHTPARRVPFHYDIRLGDDASLLLMRQRHCRLGPQTERWDGEKQPRKLWEAGIDLDNAAEWPSDGVRGMRCSTRCAGAVPSQGRHSGSGCSCAVRGICKRHKPQLWQCVSGDGYRDGIEYNNGCGHFDQPCGASRG